MSVAIAPCVMTASLKLDSHSEIAKRYSLCCPVCKGTLELAEEHCHCPNDACHAKFPIIDGVPILINESNSLFSIEDYVQRSKTYFDPNSHPKSTFARFRKTLTRWLIPTIDHNIKSERNFAKFAELLTTANPGKTPVVLVIGGSVLGQGLQALRDSGKIQFVESDVSLSSR